MVAINQNNKLNSNSLNTPDLSLDSNLRRWFSRNIGLWKSFRTYFLEDNNKTYNICMFLRIEALKNQDPWESHYKFSWYPDKKYTFFDENPNYSEKGEMKAFIKGHQLVREKFYLTNSKGISNIKQVDEHEMIFESSYDNWHILEHTRLVNMDKLRFRVIYSWSKDGLKIVENHHEIRIST
ncbi:MAG: hypothetical protein CMK49_04160 [Prochlorococcus sp. SP3034]|nr:hypothetical protein [Prochlorococcus sp. SP3034]|tara:strand:+ start:1224 stop:1766 length:543 start_codon:yes stop_codon:yes gene_type:complete